MPWKIKSTTNLTDPDNPTLTLWDQTVDLHMTTHLESGVIDLWVGGPSPDQASIWISVDSERQPVVRNETTQRHPTHKDRQVISTVLRSLSQDPERILGRRVFHKKPMVKPQLLRRPLRTYT